MIGLVLFTFLNASKDSAKIEPCASASSPTITDANFDLAIFNYKYYMKTS